MSTEAPRLTRAKSEVARIVELLESDAYDTEEALAYAVLAEAVEILSDRHLIVAWSRRYPDVLWGPFYTEKQAETAWSEHIAPVIGAEGGALLRVAPWPATPPEYLDPDFHPALVCMCGHPRWKHTNSGKRAYCGSRKEGCKCGGFTKKP